jgi:hypothetical protein
MPNGLPSTSNLFEGLGIEAGEGIVFYGVTDLDRFAAHFAVFDIALMADRQVQNHRNLFPIVRAVEGVFHGDSMLQQVHMASYATEVSEKPCGFNGSGIPQ